MKKEPSAQYSTLKDLHNEFFTLKNWYNEKFDHRFTMPFHTHPQIEIMYCVKGSFCYQYKKDSETEEYEQTNIYENMLLLANTGYYHKISINTNSATILNLEFAPTLSEPAAVRFTDAVARKFTLTVGDLFLLNRNLSKMKAEDKLFYIFNDTEHIQTTMKNLIKELDKPDGADSGIIVNLLTTKLFVDISRCDTYKIVTVSGLSYVKKATSYMRQNFMNRPSLPQIAAAATVTPAYLQTLFKREFGKSVHTLLTEIKLEHAKYLLESTNLSNGEIAKICGLNNREQLIYEFKKLEKCTPSDYRKKTEQKNSRYFSSDGEIEIK